MKLLNEWQFRFWLRPTRADQEISHEFAERVLFEVATSWARDRDYTIGGGLYDDGRYWLFNFGLCITRDDQLIPEADARELCALLSEFCTKEGYQFDGGYQEFEYE